MCQRLPVATAKSKMSTSFEGKLIAVVHRADDNEEKWVATNENETFSAAEIAARIHFMEQYFDSTVALV